MHAATQIVRLELGGKSGRVWLDAFSEAGSREYPLELGVSAVVALFHRDPPREADIESAIDIVEEAVMPFAKLLPRGAALVAADPLTRQLAALAAGTGNVESVSLQAVEALFERLAAAARRGAWVDATRMDASVAAGVIILREFMHHAFFDSIQLT